jgi:hypothetical protein
MSVNGKQLLDLILPLVHTGGSYLDHSRSKIHRHQMRWGLVVKGAATGYRMMFSVIKLRRPRRKLGDADCQYI